MQSDRSCGVWSFILNSKSGHFCCDGCLNACVCTGSVADWTCGQRGLGAVHRPVCRDRLSLQGREGKLGNPPIERAFIAKSVYSLVPTGLYLCLLKTVFIYHLTHLCFELTLVVLKPFAQASSAVLVHASLYFCALQFVVLSYSFCFLIFRS